MDTMTTIPLSQATKYAAQEDCGSSNNNQSFLLSGWSGTWRTGCSNRCSSRNSLFNAVSPIPKNLISSRNSSNDTRGGLISSPPL
ncbi:hypothetical protein RvY_10134-2 [Ramazzottius varieornatus]|uniref:Uncharacterized protein n=1 Tax=Ramazzottius varieornatus TaxID=947166 RepID=A0A1D1VBS7_RAMVA|nr:hypothetical protein RvY_10134-2 [Ramazzottius varieornatus]